MSRCPITYQPLTPEELKIGYSHKGLSLLSPALKSLKPIEYTAEQLREEGADRSAKMSIQGVQPKVSVRVSVAQCAIKIVTIGGKFILKPQHPYHMQLPENEDLTMKMASVIDIEVPIHGLVKSIDGTFSYLVKRFDRISQRSKLPVEDFAQIMGKYRDSKYDSSIEQVVGVINRYCSFPVVEKRKLFRRLLFCYVTGNEDMHLKNYSLITRNKKVELSPAYDLVNTTIALGGDVEEMALPIKGKKRGITKSLLIKYLGRERLELSDYVIGEELDSLLRARKNWHEIIENSFLGKLQQERYLEILEKRLNNLN